MFNGKVWKDGKLWLVEIPALDVMTQGHSKKDALFMIKDAIEELVDEKSFHVKVVPAEKKSEFIIYANNVAPLVALMLKRQRVKNGLSLADMQERLHAKSRNTYAQYEQGRCAPTVQKLVEFLSAMGVMALFMCAHGRSKSRG
jgi:predicted RNase H-like HicB family nuclease/DNA-binding XRE family transcriptional regulator